MTITPEARPNPEMTRRRLFGAVAAVALAPVLTGCDNNLPFIGDTIPKAKGRDGLELNGVAHETLRGIGADLANILEANGGSSRSPERYDNSDSESCIFGEVVFDRMGSLITVHVKVDGTNVSISYKVGSNNETIQRPNPSLTIDAIRSALNDTNTETIAFGARYRNNDGGLVISSMDLSEGSQAQVVVGGKNTTQPTDTSQQRSAALNTAISHLKVASENISNVSGSK